jgi:hypothetical protein
MILRIFILSLLTLNTTPMKSQSLEDEYRLSGIHDLAASFMFAPDGHFEFYYAYGASDRNATGTYTIEDNVIKLKSDKEGGNDFHIDKQEKAGKGYTIQVSAPNPQLLSNISCFYFIGDAQEIAPLDSKGFIHLDINHCDRIYLRHELFPDIPSLIKDADNPNNTFAVSMLPSLVQVSFKGIDLFIEENVLTCLPNYFMPFSNIRFVKR